MPTGYTAAVQDGSITTLREFALRCARAFGALIQMRDDPMDAALPEKIKPDTRFYDDMIAAAEKALHDLPLLTEAACEQRAQRQYDEEVVYWTETRTKREAEAARYRSMLTKVNGWKPAAAVSALRDFMIEQLTGSLKFDCDYKMPTPKKLDGKTWRREALAKAQRDLEYGTTQRDLEIARTDERNAWLEQLRASLPET